VDPATDVMNCTLYPNDFFISDANFLSLSRASLAHKDHRDLLAPQGLRGLLVLMVLVGPR